MNLGLATSPALWTDRMLNACCQTASGDEDRGDLRHALTRSLIQTRAVVCLAANVRFGSKADIGACVMDVRFTPESGHSV